MTSLETILDALNECDATQFSPKVKRAIVACQALIDRESLEMRLTRLENLMAKNEQKDI